MPIGPVQQYVIKYNGYQLPGYAQAENDDSTMTISTHYGPYWDGGLSEYMGLSNKDVTLRFKLWECSYREAKDYYMQATAILRSKRSGWAPLFVDYTDRYYNARCKQVTREKEVPSSTKQLEYIANFETQPWMISISGHTITGTGIITTDAVGRTIANGGWSPTTVTITGTDVTISGFTETGEFAGFISVSGSCSNLVVDTEAFTAYEGSTNANGKMAWKDYQLWVGPGKTTFTTTGASSFSLSYVDRWY